MNKLTVLLEGYAKKLSNDTWKASSTVTLLESNGKKIIVDPGCNRKMLINSLLMRSLLPDDIDYVMLTHGHIDHTLLAGIFERARIVNNKEIFEGDKQVPHKNFIPETDLEILQTPGHSDDHCSVLVNTDEGKYIVAGDLFWWTSDEEQKIDIYKSDPACMNDLNQLVESRKKVLEIADFIIPGHGGIIRNR